MSTVATAAQRQTRPQGRVSARPRPADAQIVAGLRSRDDKALERLFVEYGELIAHWARSSGTESDDIVQDVLFKVWKSGTRLDPDTRLPAYLKTVTQNTVRNSWRTKTRKPAVPIGLEPADEAASDPMADATERVAVGQALEKLNARERECLQLLYVSDMPLADVARKLGASPQATKSLAARARRRIRADLEKVAGSAAATGAIPAVAKAAQAAEVVGHAVGHKVAAVAMVFLTAGALTFAAGSDGDAPAPADPVRALTADVADTPEAADPEATAAGPDLLAAPDTPLEEVPPAAPETYEPAPAPQPAAPPSEDGSHAHEPGRSIEAGIPAEAPGGKDESAEPAQECRSENADRDAEHTPEPPTQGQAHPGAGLEQRVSTGAGPPSDTGSQGAAVDPGVDREEPRCPQQ